VPLDSGFRPSVGPGNDTENVAARVNSANPSFMTLTFAYTRNVIDAGELA
jgi:hypothetical protein